MLGNRFVYLFVASFAVMGILRAAEIGGSSSSSSTVGKTDMDTIELNLEYYQRMVSMTEAYLRDRAKIPADYQSVSDKEFLRKSKLEKVGTKKMTTAPTKAGPAATPKKK